MKKKSWLYFVVLVAVSLGSWYFNTPTEESDYSAVPTEVSGDYELLENCKLVAGKRIDGDSFFVRHDDKQTEFRLYYVDAPESAFKTYRNGEDNGKRLDDQAKDFGGISRERTIEIGNLAKDEVKRILSMQPFSIITRWENVYSPERKYAFVIVRPKANDAPVYLHEYLVRKGLVRIHTKPSTMPDGKSTSEQLAHLRKLEKQAQQDGVGVWAQ